jgi:hypothetical protein
MVLFGETNATMRHDGTFNSGKSSFAGEPLSSICVFPRGEAIVCTTSQRALTVARKHTVELGAEVACQTRCLELHPTLCEWVLDGLILANGPTKDIALLGVDACFPEGSVADA